MIIRHATLADVPALDGIARGAKAHWGYGAEQLALWDAALRTPPASLATHPTLLAETDAGIVAFAQLEPHTDPWELAALWVLPAHMGRGVGRTLLLRVAHLAAEAGQAQLHIDADPHAAGFYRSLGAVAVGTVAAPIEGQPQRVRPQLRLRLEGVDRRPP